MGDKAKLLTNIKPRPVNWKSWVIVAMSSLVIVVFQNCDGKLAHQSAKPTLNPTPLNSEATDLQK